MLSYDDEGVYKINVNNPTYVMLISLGFTSAARSICGSGSCEARLLMVKDEKKKEVLANLQGKIII